MCGCEPENGKICGYHLARMRARTPRPGRKVERCDDVMCRAELASPIDSGKSIPHYIFDSGTFTDHSVNCTERIHAERIVTSGMEIEFHGDDH